MKTAQREFDLIVFGTTGFAGGVAAEYFASHFPKGVRWAVGGRSPSKLGQLTERLSTLASLKFARAIAMTSLLPKSVIANHDISVLLEFALDCTDLWDIGPGYWLYISNAKVSDCWHFRLSPKFFNLADRFC